MISIIAVGAIKERFFKDGCAEYLKRIQRSVDVRITELKPSTVNNPQKQQTEESERILKALAKTTGPIFICDERGKSMDSPALASHLQTAKDHGEAITFVVGGAFGMNDAVRNIGRVMKLSDCVFPHELFRMMLLEQIYRGCEINRGSKYHHE